MKIFKIYRLFFIIAFSLALATISTKIAFAEVEIAKNMREVKTKVETLLKHSKPEDILVLFDIDMTLTKPDHPATSYPAAKKFGKFLKKFLKSKTPEQIDFMLTLTTQVLPQVLIEQDTVKIIKSLQNQNIKVIAFTATLAGRFTDNVNKFIFKRYQDLQELEIDFSNSLNEFVNEVTFTNFPLYAHGYPMFYQGILCSNGEKNHFANKGSVLAAFLDHIGNKQKNKARAEYIPKVIVFIDDKVKNLDTVKQNLSKYYPRINYIPIHYQGAFSIGNESITHDEFIKFWEILS